MTPFLPYETARFCAPTKHFAGNMVFSLTWEHFPMVLEALRSGAITKGQVVGLSGNGLIDPLIGAPEGRGVLWDKKGSFINDVGMVVGFADTSMPDPTNPGGFLPHGNSSVSALFGPPSVPRSIQATFPTGQYKNGSSKAIITPTIAYGKGFGRFDIQGTFGATLPTGNEAKIGRTFPWNNAFQYHVSKKLWPEIETNYTRFQDGPNRGKTQVFMTPGILFGNFHVGKRLSLNFGGGFQVATTRFHVNNHNGIFTVRFPF